MCVYYECYYLLLLRGHPFMTSTRKGRGVRLRWTHADGEGAVGSTWTSTEQIFKLEPTVILSSFHAKKLTFFGPEFCHWTE